MKRTINCFFCFLILLVPVLLGAKEPARGVLPVFNSTTGKVEKIKIDENVTKVDGFIPEGMGTNALLEKAIIGPENWYQVDGSQYPYSSAIFLSMKGRTCSGSLVGPYTVLTNAHCVYEDVDHNNGTLVNPTAVTAFAGGKQYKASANGVRIYVAPGTGNISWSREFRTKDYAIVVLDKPLGYRVGYLGIKKSEVKKGEKLFVIGFPGKKSHDRPWLSPGKVLSVYAGYLHYDNDALPGNSGSPVFYSQDLTRVIAVHSFGDDTSPNPRYNGATKPVNNALVNFVQKYRMEKPSEVELDSLRQQQSAQCRTDLSNFLQNNRGQEQEIQQEPSDQRTPGDVLRDAWNNRRKK